MTARAPPLVSVIVPAHDAEATLEATLRSAAAQTHANLEIVIIDDGSTDATPEIAAGFCRSEARARLLAIPHAGAAAARNRGLEAARGEFVAFLDADDLWHPEKIEKQVAKALECPEAGFVYTFYRRIDDEGNRLDQPAQFEVQGWAFWRHLYWNFAGSASGVLARKSAVAAAGGFHEGPGARVGEDHLLQLRLAARYPVACIPEFLFDYRDRPASLSSDRAAMLRGWREAVAILERSGDLPRSQVTAWTFSRAGWGLAIESLRRGRPLKAAGFFLRALRDDPLRTLLNAKRVLARSLGRRGPRRGAQVAYPLDEARMRELAARDVGPIAR